MAQRRSRKTRALRKGQAMGISTSEDHSEFSQLATAILLDHSYNRMPGQAGSSKGLRKRHLKKAVALPDIRPAASVSSVEVCQEEEAVSIHGCSVEAYQEIYRSVAEPLIKSRSGRRRPYSLEQGLKIKQRLWKTLKQPVLLETVLPDGRVQVQESFSKSSRRAAPQFQVDISEEPLPEEPARKKPRH